MNRVHIPSGGFIGEFSFRLPITDCELEKLVLRFLVISIALSIVLLAAILSILGPGETWAYFSGTTDELFGITTGFWDAPIPGVTSLAAEKNAQGFYEDIGGLKQHGVRGQVCVTNPGDFPTQNLSIEDRVQVKLRFSQFADYIIFPVDVSLKPVLAPGESYCYPYQVAFLPVPGASYRNSARVTVTNHAGWLPGSQNCPGPLPCPFGPNPKIGFSLPDTPAEIWLPENPAPPRLGVLTPTADEIIRATAKATAEATAEATAKAIVEATATPSPQPSITHTSTATPENQRATPTPAPTLKPESTCVYPVDYWKDHLQEWPLSEIVLGSALYSHQQALELLALEPGEDAPLLLAHQLIAARLNLANGADGETIENLLGESDEWLEENPLFSHPEEQARKQGKSLAGQLEEYNSGESGLEACLLGKVTPTSAPTYELAASPTPEPSATPTLTLTATWTPTFTVEPPTVSPSAPPTETPLPSSPTSEPSATATDTPLPDPPTPTLAPTEEIQPIQPPQITEEPTPLPW